MERWVCSDHHFDHANILKFTTSGGHLIRPGFSSVEEMNETLVARHNAVVAPNDKVYFLGDVCWKEKSLAYVRSMNGIKILVRGNHDTLAASTYLKAFADVVGVHTHDKFVMTHIPIHTDSMSRWVANIHGHLHTNKVNDPRYYCACVEQLDNYHPVNIEQIKQHYKNLGLYV